MLYGLDLPELETAARESQNPSEPQEEASELTILHTIQKYLAEKRAEIQRGWNNSLETSVRTAGRLLPVEKTRLETLER